MTDTRSQTTDVEQFDAQAVNAAWARKPLYEARKKIFPKRASGQFRRFKWLIMFITLGIYYLTPWIRWDRGPFAPDQAVLVDIANRRFYFFFIEIWPQEFFFVAGLLVMAGFGLFLVTSAVGRAWCGYTCPQTVWVDLFLVVERAVEGERNQRMKLDKAPWSVDKLVKRVSKHAIWLLIAVATGGAWIFYFADAPTLLVNAVTGQAEPVAYITVAVLTATTYLFGGLMREQVCTYMCPWPRIQAALTDEETLQVTYKVDRGEPRGPHKKGQSWDGRGDCVACKACVAACPMGIDIRDGAQLECINCALCIDACDEIMEKVGRPLGLIAYDTDANMERRTEGKKPLVKILRARTILYGVVLALVTAIMLYTLINRDTVNLNVLRDRTPPYVMLSDGSVRNAYTVKIINRDNIMRSFQLDVDGPEEMSLNAVGEEFDGASRIVTAGGDGVRSLRLFITMPADALDDASIPITISVTDVDSGEKAVNPTVFLSKG